MAEEGQERTEAPTPKRLQKARDDGDILTSRELASALIVLAGCGWFALLGPGLLSACKAVMASSLQFGRGDVEHFEPFRPLAEAGWKLAPSLIGLFTLSILAAIASQGALSGIRFSPKAWTPNPGKLNPLSGMKRIFGVQGWIELGKSLLKVVLLGAIGTWLLLDVTQGMRGLSSTSDVRTAVGTLGGSLTGLLFAMSGGLVLIAGVDVPIQIMRRAKRLRMSKQEVKDEHKDAEGSPENKAAIRRRQREVLKKSFRKAVAEAHVILTNPTHFSVALRYDRDSDQVPVVVAKGRGATALAIRELAAELDVPLLEYPALARAVYFTSQEGQEIRDDLYLAVATVLAFVFGLNAAAGGSQPPITVPPTARFDENGIKTLH